MNLELCKGTQARFSDYLDGAVSGREMQSVASHLEQCVACRNEFASWRSVQNALTEIGQRKAPVDLGLKLRVAISQESARRTSRWQDRFAVRWENLVRPALLQVSAGLAGTVLLVGGLAAAVGVVAAPQAVMANDEPLGAVTAPHYAYSIVPETPVVTALDTILVVEAKINAEGLVYDYTVLSGPQDAVTMEQVRRQLLMQVYTPARVFNSPVSSRVIVTFAGVQVRG